MIRRPKSRDYAAGAVVDTLQSISSSTGGMTRDARHASSKLARAATLLVLLQVLLVPVLAWFQSELPAWLGIAAVYAALGLAAATFWMLCGKPELSKRLRSKRERLEDLDDTAVMRARLLAEEGSPPGL
jgi:hypothetical protein